MNIEFYKHAKDIPETYLTALVNAEIECWGSSPFSEYRICNDCSAIFSIEEVHWNFKNFKLSKSSEDFECTECFCSTRLFYEKEIFIKQIKEYIKQNVSATLLIWEKKNIWGFWVTTTKDVEDLLDLELNTRVWSYNKEKVLSKISEEVFNLDNCSEEEISCLHQIYLSPDFRNWNLAFLVLKNMFPPLEWNKNLPIITETRYDSKFYSISRAMWFTDLIADKYGYVIQYIKHYSEILDFFNNHDSFFDQRISNKRENYKKTALTILAKHSEFKKRKFYN